MIKLLSLSFLALFGFIVFAGQVQTQTDLNDPLGLDFGGPENTGLPDTDLRVAVGNIIKTILGLLGIIAVVLILYAGFTWMTSAGNEEKIDTAKKTLLAAVIGLAIILSAYIITSFVISSLYEATSGQTYGTP